MFEKQFGFDISKNKLWDTPPNVPFLPNIKVEKASITSYQSLVQASSVGHLF